MKKISGLTPREFTEKYYKQERLHGRGDEYAETIIRQNEIDFEDLGECYISKHECILCEFTMLTKK